MCVGGKMELKYIQEEGDNILRRKLESGGYEGGIECVGDEMNEGTRDK